MEPNSFYPPDWPRCPSCGDFAMDGHITCGRYECDESYQRDNYEPPEPDGECFRGSEAQAYEAEQQAWIQRNLK